MYVKIFFIESFSSKEFDPGPLYGNVKHHSLVDEFKDVKNKRGE